MNQKLFIGILIIILLLISGCTNKELNTFNADKELLTNEILQLKKLISEKDGKIIHLEKVYSNKLTELRELTDSLNLIRFSSIARLNDYNNSFDDLKKIYKINSKYEIIDDWYVINDDFFQIELLENEYAKKVDFYILRMESHFDPILVFTDTDSSDGWIYTNDNISKVIEKHKQATSRSLAYVPYFIIYTEVTQEDGNVIMTSKLPIYNK